MPDDVREWYSETDPDWPVPTGRWFNDVADDCNRARCKQVSEQQAAAALKPSRKRFQALRAANATILKEAPPVLCELASWLPSERIPELVAGHRRLRALYDASVALYEASRRARPALERIRDPGGQPRRHASFACRNAKRVLVLLEQHGIEWSFYPDGALIRFIAHLVHAVYDENISLEALSREIQRDQDIRRYFPNPRSQSRQRRAASRER
jgi:hypothetical protein